MGLIRRIFHKIKIGFTRIGESPIPDTTACKKYGDQGEKEFFDTIQTYLPDCRIKKNIVIQTAEGNAEIDCLLLCKNKLFAIEVKRWKGRLVEQADGFVQYKQDFYTDEVHTKVHHSPFKQLDRAVYLLKRQIPGNAWINKVVFFEESDGVETDGGVWFDNYDGLIAYIHGDGKASSGKDASAFFDECIAADYLYCSLSERFLNCSPSERSLHCVVCDDSLRFTTSTGVLDRSNIRSMSIEHHWSYDEVEITTKDGECYTVTVENGSLFVIENGHRERYALCKLDYIHLGD